MATRNQKQIFNYLEAFLWRYWVCFCLFMPEILYIQLFVLMYESKWYCAWQIQIRLISILTSMFIHVQTTIWERSGSVVECLTQDWGAAGWSRVVSLSKNINPSLVLVKPRKTHPFITERLLMGRKESNQTKTSSLSVRTFAAHIHKVFRSL